MIRRAVLATIAAALLGVAPASAWAADFPPYEGALGFPAIEDSAGPEEFTWEVQLSENQELRQIDDQYVAVYHVDPEHLAFGIAAEAAHDAEGKAVPTTLTVTEPNLVTLTVHHRAGNPDAGGAPFDYPIAAGEGWEGGFQTHEVVMPPPEPVVAPSPPAPAARCDVPRLGGKSLKAARKLLKQANCRLGPVRGERVRGAKVVRQFRKPGRSLPPGTEVGVKLG